jgi:glyoxylase-like metal-dependent hydrolase (beta-lactamase superfamily II)
VNTGAARAQLRTQKLADGVYAILQPAERRFDDSNSAVILLDDGVFVVDTQVSPLSALAVLAEIRKLTDLPVRWVLNTHWHGDHVQGNQVYLTAFPHAEFIAHTSTADDIRGRAMPAHEADLRDVPPWLERARATLEAGVLNGQTLDDAQKEQLRGRIERRQAYLDGARSITSFVTPTRLFDDSLTIASGRQVHLMHRAGHTRGDVAVWIPEAKVLITGDLIDDLPFTGHGSPNALLETLRDFDRFDFTAMIPGHGPVRTDHQHLRDVQAFLASIIEQTGTAVSAGLTLEDTQKKIDLSEHRPRFVTDDVSARYWGFFTAEAVRRAWEEARERAARS